jgi:hypothetical protein
LRSRQFEVKSSFVKIRLLQYLLPVLAWCLTLNIHSVNASDQNFLETERAKNDLLTKGALNVGPFDAHYNFKETTLDIPLIYFDSIKKTDSKEFSFGLSKEASSWLTLSHEEILKVNEVKTFDFDGWKSEENSRSFDLESKIGTRIQPLSAITITPFVGLKSQEALQIPSGTPQEHLGIESTIKPFSTTSIYLQTSKVNGSDSELEFPGNNHFIDVEQRLTKSAKILLSMADYQSLSRNAKFESATYEYSLELQPSSTTTFSVGQHYDRFANDTLDRQNLITEDNESYFVRWTQRLLPDFSLNNSLEYSNREPGEETPDYTKHSWSMSSMPSWKLADTLSLQAGYKISLSEEEREFMIQKSIEQSTSVELRMQF